MLAAPRRDGSRESGYRGRMRRFSLLLVAAFMLVTAGPASAQLAPPPKPILTTIDKVPMVELYDGGGGLPYLGSTTSYNAGDWENALKAYHDTVYEQQIGQIDAIADAAIKKASPRGWQAKVRKARAADHGHGHDHGKNTKKLAIVLDIDETSLSNYSAILADNFTFGTNSQQEAQNEIGVAIKPTLDLYDDALQRGYAVFFITGRGEATRPFTEDNLKKQGFTTWSQLVLKPAGSTLSTVAFKSGARAAIEQQGYRIVANIGDQYSDLAGGHAESAFKLANPFYFLP
jgi:predicted secreted acid phosphatase